MNVCWNVGPARLCLRQGDIVTADVDAVVNAANSGLAGGGGVDGALHRAAGPELLQAGQEIVRQRGPVQPGQAVLTPGYRLRARYVIHAVGPVWRGGQAGEEYILCNAYRSCLHLARTHALESLAFPAISCGAYGYPVDEAARVALSAVREGLEAGSVKYIVFYLFSAPAHAAWAAAARDVLGPAEFADK